MIRPYHFGSRWEIKPYSIAIVSMGLDQDIN